MKKLLLLVAFVVGLVGCVPGGGGGSSQECVEGLPPIGTVCPPDISTVEEWRVYIRATTQCPEGAPIFYGDRVECYNQETGESYVAAEVDPNWDFEGRIGRASMTIDGGRYQIECSEIFISEFASVIGASKLIDNSYWQRLTEDEHQSLVCEGY